MDSNAPLDDQIRVEPEVRDTEYRPSTNTLRVIHDDGHFSQREIDAIRQGKLTPLYTDGAATDYCVNITLEEQRKERASKFSFSV